MQLPQQLRRRNPDSHKGNFGHIFILGGSTGLTGSVCLAALAALRSGAGLVTAGVPKSLNPVFEIKLTEIMSLPLKESRKGVLSTAAFTQIKNFSKKTLGKKGEEIALKYLKKKGYKILATNYRCPLGEIDIIAKYKKVIAFIEVKTRRSSTFGLPQESVNQRKQYQLSKVALYRLTKTKARFDVVSVLIDNDSEKVELIQDAFELRYL